MNIGIDIVAIKRFKKIKKADRTHWKKVFTDQEWEYAFLRPNPALQCAGMFAAKEAAMKATEKAGSGYFIRHEILHKKSGAPYFKNKRFSLSISHDELYAIAVALYQ